MEESLDTHLNLQSMTYIHFFHNSFTSAAAVVPAFCIIILLPMNCNKAPGCFTHPGYKYLLCLTFPACAQRER